MRIARVEIYACELTPRAGGFHLSGNRTAETETSFLARVASDTDLEGWGEACPLTSSYLPAFSGGVGAALAELSPALIGADPRELGSISARMDATLLGQEAAKSALDVACWDLLGRAAELPVTTLLGGRMTSALPLYEAVPMGTVEETEERVRAARERGMTRFQVKVGDDPGGDVARVRRVVEVAGGGALVVADANGGWQLDDALRALRDLEVLPIYLEQPCRSFTECLHVRRATRLPMIYDESVTGVESLVAAVRDGGASVVNLKLGKVGGLTQSRMLRDVARSLGARVTIEDTWGGDVTTAAVSHLAASTPTASLFSVSFPNDHVLERTAAGAPQSEGGTGSAPSAAGLGIEVDAGAVGEPVFSTELR